ncbi:hypothetical protein GDO78_001730 [Eleutherodactylus coqui]|uniref:Uncharacterized protein n=1 Tax=Eleutherodactylus coqui TaxID=57060 RepID=A0A8J6FTY9_ELECQ|nr:hypothetical protein GDO78_001730 [Eleutherodactylus coqui]
MWFCSIKGVVQISIFFYLILLSLNKKKPFQGHVFIYSLFLNMTPSLQCTIGRASKSLHAPLSVSHTLHRQ